MSVAVAESSLRTTEHGLLVPLGRFAAQIGLLAAFEQVPFPMKTVVHRPAEKLGELFVHILAGGMHVKELAVGPRPLVRDTAVAEAWGQASFASSSGVSDLLRVATEATVAALTAELRRVSAPYRQRLLRELTPSWLVVDCDLTGLVVSDQATTYQGADFGYMGEVGTVAKGYQFARAQVAGRRDALLLGGFLHPGRTVSAHCLEQLVGLVEAELGRPRRRVEVVEPRLAAAEHELAALEAAAAARPPGRPPGPRLLQRLDRQRQAVAELRATRDRLAADNAANPTPRRILLRLDGGFGDAALLGWLYEQGYDFVARAHSHRVAETLRREPDLHWAKISKNGWIAASRRTALGACPYPLRLFACRQWRGTDRPEHWSALVASPDLDPSTWPARRVGVFYNERQVIEAGIKESKHVLASRHLPTRHRAGIALYQALVLFAQNLLRWFRRQWLGHTPLATAGIKTLVRLGANCPALLVHQADSDVLHFTAPGPWEGLILPLRRTLGYQLWFSFLENHHLARAQP